MQIIRTPEALKAALKSDNGSIGFVPTMGALHNGHRSLIEQARAHNDTVVVSIFVNPTQFLEGEDLDKYPRRFEADEKICQLSRVDYLFHPEASAIYGEDEVRVLAPQVRGYILEGCSRPGHFDGMLTVVMKLLNIVTPTNAYFGKKDAQQLFLIRQMAENLFMDVNIVAVDTMRESDGLALSSRNIYLNAQEREEALKIARSLKCASNMVIRNLLDSSIVVGEMMQVLAPLEVEYVAVVDRRFNPIGVIEKGNTIILVAARVGSTRLIDNIWI